MKKILHKYIYLNHKQKPAQTFALFGWIFVIASVYSFSSGLMQEDNGTDTLPLISLGCFVWSFISEQTRKPN